MSNLFRPFARKIYLGFGLMAGIAETAMVIQTERVPTLAYGYGMVNFWLSIFWHDSLKSFEIIPSRRFYG